MAKQPEETSLIQTYLAPLAGPGGLGLKDDAACLSPKPGMDLVITTDTIVENTHFLSADTPFDIAIKAVSVNLSDLVAKGAVPVGYQLALTFPRKPEASWFAEFSRGLAEQVNGKLLGGDMTVSKGGPLTITVTAIGEVPEGKMVRREGAKIGDDIYVCGAIGTNAAGLKTALDKSWVKRANLAPSAIAALYASYAAPRIPYAAGWADMIASHANAALDISDGLAIDLERLCAASGAGAVVNVEKIPLNPIVSDLISAGHFSIEEAITGGDDYVALFTAPPEVGKVLLSEKTAPCFPVGKMVPSEKGVTFLNPDGSHLSLGERTGYDHFSE